VTFCRSPFEFSALEIASGIALGFDTTRSGADAQPGADPLRALEDAILPALLHPPCVVSFSGGRDSAAVLAVASALARREGLAAPIAATNVFPGVEAASESRWQELVISHLGIEDWVRVQVHSELDCVGPIATSILRRHGLLWPFNAHFHWPLLQIAYGGSLLTGIGGDELLGTSQWARAVSVLSGRVRPTSRDLLRVSVALAPRRVRAAALRRRSGVRLPWLTEEANELLARLLTREHACEPLRWSRRWSWWRSRRQVTVGFESLNLLAADHDVMIGHPLTDRHFALAAARCASRGGIVERTALVRALFGEVLPRALLERQSKASFDLVFWNEHSRRLASESAHWLSELGVVDQTGLRRAWHRPAPDAHSFLLLQALWLRTSDSSRCAPYSSASHLDLNGGPVGNIAPAT